MVHGPMFASKSHFTAGLRLGAGHGKKTLTVIPEIDTRSKDRIASRTTFEVHAIQVKNLNNILKFVKVEEYKVLVIDEAHMFGKDLFPVVDELLKTGMDVVVSILSSDYLGKPFDGFDDLMKHPALLEKYKCHARCDKCGDFAQYTCKKTRGGERIEIGDADMYFPACEKCKNF